MNLSLETLLSASTSQIQTLVAAASSAKRDTNALSISKKKLKAFLKINDNLADSQNKSLHTAYAKYKASNAAVQLYEQMVANGNWLKKYVTVTEIRQLFISK